MSSFFPASFRSRLVAIIITSLMSFALQAVPAHANGLGGYAVIHPDGYVCGVVVATSADPFGNGGVTANEYMGCPAGSRFMFQTKPSPTGNVAGWHGRDVLYSNGTFRLSSGTTITNGIATDPNGRVWDTGSGETITPSPSAGSGSSTGIPSETSSATIPVDSESTTSPAPGSTPFSGSPTTGESATALPAQESAVASTNSVVSSPSGSTSSNNGTVTSSNPASSASSPPANSDSQVSVTTSTSSSSSNTRPSSGAPVNEVSDDGVEEDPSGELNSRRLDDGRYRLSVRTNLDSEQIVLRATKRGSKTIRFLVTLNENGRAVVLTNRDLSGYRVSIVFGDLILDAKRLP